jgi:chorismate mutase
MEFKPILFDGLDPTSPLLISGPCSAESEEQVMKTAKELNSIGIKIFRAGIWKPRTKPGGFEGVGVKGLKWLQKVQLKYGMYTAVEVATPKHIRECLKYNVDILWIGARTTVNPFAVQELANALEGVDIPVLIKNPVNPDLDLWIGAIERFYNAGVTRLGVIHRGFSTLDKKIYRNSPQWHIPIELHRQLPELPIICDPSHMGGSRELIAPISQQALDLNFNGLLIESHCNPDKALSDANQQVTPKVLKDILDNLVIRTGHQNLEELAILRHKIDELDDSLLELLLRRMNVSKEIGLYKKENNMPILQEQRYNEILQKRILQAQRIGMDAEFMKTILVAIHEESIRHQMKIMKDI